MYKYAIGNLHNVPLERPEIFARGRLHASVPRPRPGALYHITNERTAQAMRKTNLYGLNLWDLEDRIRMEDFNSDNETLEAALSALCCGGGFLLAFFLARLDGRIRQEECGAPDRSLQP